MSLPSVAPLVAFIRKHTLLLAAVLLILLAAAGGYSGWQHYQFRQTAEFAFSQIKDSLHPTKPADLARWVNFDGLTKPLAKAVAQKYPNLKQGPNQLRDINDMFAWKFYLVTFGCKVNQYETQSLREAWHALGGAECNAPAEADVVCVNSCAITAKGERDARNAVFRLRREAPHARLILTGCAARLFADYKPRPGAIWAAPDLLVPQEEKSRLLDGPWADLDGDSAPRPSADEATADVTATAPQTFPPFQISAFKRARPVLKVQDGCAHRCTYCIVPLTRGKPRSRPVDEIVAEARRLLQAGHD